MHIPTVFHLLNHPATATFPNLEVLPDRRPDPHPEDVVLVGFDRHQAYFKNGVLVEPLPQHRYRVTEKVGGKVVSVSFDPAACLAYADGLCTVSESASPAQSRKQPLEYGGEPISREGASDWGAVLLDGQEVLNAHGRVMEPDPDTTRRLNDMADNALHGRQISEGCVSNGTTVAFVAGYDNGSSDPSRYGHIDFFTFDDRNVSDRPGGFCKNLFFRELNSVHLTYRCGEELKPYVAPAEDGEYGTTIDYPDWWVKTHPSEERFVRLSGSDYDWIQNLAHFNQSDAAPERGVEIYKHLTHQP